MKNFIVHNDQGEIVRTGICMEKDLESQATEPGESVMEGIADDSINVIKANLVVNKRAQTDEEKTEQLMLDLRSFRNSLLSESDWTQIPDNSLTTTQVAAWAEYRQQLRNLPTNNAGVSTLEDIVFPTPPNN